MSDLRHDWDAVVARIRFAPALLLLTNLDGTLVPLADPPEVLPLPPLARHLLIGLLERPRLTIGVVSDLALKDVVARVDLAGVWYVGTHGYELRTPQGEETRFYEPSEVQHLDAVASELAAGTRTIPGATLEPKGPILTLHYRRVEEALIPEIEKIFLEVITRHHDRITMARGDRCFEAKLRAPCTRASAVRHIRKQSAGGALPVYFGQEMTDQDAFRELREEGLTVSVGAAAPALAQYSVPDVGAVLEVLGRLKDLLTENGASDVHPPGPAAEADPTAPPEGGPGGD